MNCVCALLAGCEPLGSGQDIVWFLQQPAFPFPSINTWALWYVNTWALWYVNTWALWYVNTWALWYVNTWALEWAKDKPACDAVVPQESKGKWETTRHHRHRIRGHLGPQMICAGIN